VAEMCRQTFFCCFSAIRASRDLSREALILLVDLLQRKQTMGYDAANQSANTSRGHVERVKIERKVEFRFCDQREG
jgi:hypothetical protein